jgi:hypothetical protein
MSELNPWRICGRIDHDIWKKRAATGLILVVDGSHKVKEWERSVPAVKCTGTASASAGILFPPSELNPVKARS